MDGAAGFSAVGGSDLILLPVLGEGREAKGGKRWVSDAVLGHERQRAGFRRYGRGNSKPLLPSLVAMREKTKILLRFWRGAHCAFGLSYVHTGWGVVPISRGLLIKVEFKLQVAE